jgi:anhydro-N-acetylmuramic acid kinase
MTDRLQALLDSPERIVAGVMSGTSLDGVDAVIARIRGSGRALELEQLAFVHTPYPEALRDALHCNVEVGSSDVRALSQLNALLGRFFADAVSRAVNESGIGLGGIDLVGSHGHTVHHVPDPEPFAGFDGVASTFQLGDPAVVATRLGIPVVGDFRTADVAIGGQGAPLVPYFDWALFTDDREHRALLNLGGIANVTVLPAEGDLGAVRAFDTGPANMVIDALARRLYDEPFDRDGGHAAAGAPDGAALAELLADDYFHRPPPKSTGREAFGTAYVEAFAARGGAPDDLLATATALTVRSVADALDRFAAEPPLDVLIVSGGGTRNAELMRQLRAAVAPLRVCTSADFGIGPDAKEALCFAVLAHEWCNGVPTNLPSVTGASRPTLLGKLCLP